MNRAHRKRWPWAMLGLLAVSWGATAQNAYREEAIKAAFLYRFTSYVEWPDSTLRSGKFTVSVLGSESVGRELTRVFGKFKVKNLPARVRQVTSPEQALDSHIVYVGPDYPGSIQDVVAVLNARPVLVVTDNSSGLDQGSTVNFLVADRRVRFEVSVTAASHSRLKISSQLLAVAARVRGAKLQPAPGERCGPAYADPLADIEPCASHVALLP